MHLYLKFNSLGVIGSPTVTSIASGTLKCSLYPINLTFNPPYLSISLISLILTISKVIPSLPSIPIISFIIFSNVYTSNGIPFSIVSIS